MVCEQVVPPAPLLSSANEWIPVTWYSYDEASDVSQCRGLVYEDDGLPFIFFPLVLFYVLFYFVYKFVFYKRVMKI